MSKIVFASSSPRRKLILSKYNNIDISFVSSDIKENVDKKDFPEQIAMGLAYEKAYNVSKKVCEDEIIIGADTIVFKDEILGKPNNKEEAISMLKLLSGEYHYVITGIAVIKSNSNLKIIDYEKTKVKFRRLTNEKIERYINTGEFKDKAGGYGIQGYGQVFVEKIEGCYFNVVGLPVGKLDKILEKYFNMSLL